MGTRARSVTSDEAQLTCSSPSSSARFASMSFRDPFTKLAVRPRMRGVHRPLLPAGHSASRHIEAIGELPVVWWHSSKTMRENAVTVIAPVSTRA